MFSVDAAADVAVGIVDMVEKRRRSGKGKRTMRVNSSPMMRWRLWRWLRPCRRFLALLALVLPVLDRFSQSLS